MNKAPRTRALRLHAMRQSTALFCALAGLLLIALALPTHGQGLSPIAGDSTERLPGKMVWADLITSDIESAAAFYRSVFGWRTQASDDSTYLTVTAGGKPIAAISSYEDEAPEGEAFWLASFSVEDVDDAMQRAVSRGGTELAAAEELPVASIGSTAMTNRSSNASGTLK